MALSTGCVGQASFNCPAEGGPPWFELRSKHYVMRTDMSLDDARSSLLDFERIYSSISDLWSAPGIGNPVVAFRVSNGARAGSVVTRAPGGRIEIVLFDHFGAFREFANPNVDGYYFPGSGSWDETPSVVTHDGGTERTRVILLHELAHRFVRFHYPQAPVWLSEGFAVYYQTLEVEDGRAWLGRSAYGLGTEALLEAPTVRWLLDADAPAFYRWRQLDESDVEAPLDRQASYAGAWALVHLLKNGEGGYPERLSAYLSALVEAKTPEKAWTDAFAGIPEARLEADYQRLLRARERAVLSVPYAPSPAPIESERTMRAAEVHLLRAKLFLRERRQTFAVIRNEVDEAARHEPHSAETAFWGAQLALLQHAPRDAERLLRDAVARQPGEVRYLLALFGLLLPELHGTVLTVSPSFDWSPAEQLEPKLSQMASSPEAQNGLAWYYALRQRPDSGLPLVMRAIFDDPSCALCYDTYALLLFEKKDIEGAVRAETIALNLHSERLPERRDMLQRLSAYRAALRTVGR